MDYFDTTVRTSIERKVRGNSLILEKRKSDTIPKTNSKMRDYVFQSHTQFL